MSLKGKKLGFVGAGNMAQALFIPLRDFFRRKQIDIFIFTPTKVRAKSLAAEICGSVVSEITDLNDCDYIVLAHKPQQFQEVASQMELKANCAIVSILASIDTKQISRAFKVENVLRLMPNTPARIGKGVITCFSQTDEKETFDEWISAFSEYSLVEIFEREEMIDLTTPELGSGPGIVLELIRIFSDSLKAKGIPKERAISLSSQVFSGSGQIVSQSGESPESLRDKVTSQGGITMECLKCLKHSKIENIFQESFKAGHNKAKELKR